MKNLARLVLISMIGMTVTHCASTKTETQVNRADNAGAESEALRTHTIYFDFDRYHIRADQQDNAMEMARSLMAYSKTHPDLKVQIQGHTDDRGSVEYNMALGTRRAESLKTYLTEAGVKPKVLDTVSFGKERPAVVGTTETAWAQNRRDDVVVLAE